MSIVKVYCSIAEGKISHLSSFDFVRKQCLSQDLETGCLKLAVVKHLGIQIFKGDHNILVFQP